MSRIREQIDQRGEVLQIAKLEKQEQQAWKRERLQVIRLGIEGELTYEQIARVSGRCMDTIRRWFNAFRSGGVEQLLSRQTGKKPDSRNRLTARAAEELKQGLAAGRWRTGPQVRQWLADEHQIQIAEGERGAILMMDQP